MHRLFRSVMTVLLAAVLVGSSGLSAPQPTRAQGSIWIVRVYNGTEPASSPLVWTGGTNTINFNWGEGAPVIGGASTGAPVNNFSVVFESTFYFTAGTYRFTAIVDDGVRVTLGSTTIISSWEAAGQRTLTVDYGVSEGNQLLRVEMFDASGPALIQFGWTVPTAAGTGGTTTTGTCTEGYGLYTTCPYGSSPGSGAAPAGWPASTGPKAICADGWNSCSTDPSGGCASHGGVLYWCIGGTSGTGTGVVTGNPTPWTAEYFANADLSGAPAFTTTLPASGINQNWGTNSPGGSVPADNWSARFTRSLNVPDGVPEGMYLFMARADDNFRLTIDTTVIIDKWDTFAANEISTAEVALLNGPHTIKFEYRDRDAGALAFLTWSPPNGQNPTLGVDGQGVPITGVSGQGGLAGATLTAKVNVPTLNVRSEPSTSASVITRITQDSVYSAVARTPDNQWIQIWLDATTRGWVAARYVTLSGDINLLPGGDTAAAEPQPTPQPIGVRARVLGNLRIRQGPSTRTARIGLLPWGTEVDVIGRSFGNVWYQIIYEDKVGWMYSPYTRIIEGDINSVPFTDGTEPAYAPPPPTSGVIVQAFGNMRIRSGPGLNYPKINRIAWGTQVQLLGVDPTGFWYKIQYGPVIGWSYRPWYRVVQGDPSLLPVLTE